MLKKEDNFVLTNEFPIKLEMCSLTQNGDVFHCFCKSVFLAGQCF